MENTERRTTTKRPSASRLIDALRDTGYSFETAIADLVDNSIAALATDIDIRAYLDDDGTQIVYIADNGHGMTEDILEDAMTYGSEERVESRSLGKFGLGMKTASTSQAKSFTVVTKTPSGGVHSATWDVEHVALKDEWELLWDYPDQDKLEEIIDSLPANSLDLEPLAINPDDEIDKIRYRCLHCEFGEEGENTYEEVKGHISHLHGTPEGSGTIVLWEKIDRVIKKYSEPSGSHAQNAWGLRVNALREHLEMVFERYISPEYTSVRTLKILLNGDPLVPWDPFCKNHAYTRKIMSTPFTVDDDSGNHIGEMTMTAYAVPHKNQFSDIEERKYAKMDDANKWQGIYVYREDRMLVAHDWFKLRARESHQNMLRIELNFDYRLDDDLQLDFKKTRVVFKPAIREAIKDQWLPNVAREAQRLYRERGSPSGEGAGGDDTHEESDTIIDEIEVPDLDVDVPPGTEDGPVTADVTNPEGSHQVRITVSSTERGTARVESVESLQGNLIYQPAIIDGKKGVQLNTGHEFYRKVYVPNMNIRAVTLGLDGLFWALSMAELKALPASDSARWFENLRWELTRIMDTFAANLPEHEEDES